jgi:hypothetical protein
MAKSTPIGQKIINAGLDLLSPKHSFLSTFLLREKKDPNSFWKPYIDLLPTDYNSFPVFFSEDELKWLEGSPFYGNENNIYVIFQTKLKKRSQT